MELLTACHRNSFILFPIVITAPGEYLTRRGEIVVVTHIGAFWCYGFHLSDGIEDTWPKCGRHYSSQETVHDIVSKAD